MRLRRSRETDARTHMAPEAAGQDDIDGRTDRSRAAPLEALALARRTSDFSAARRTRWMVGAGVGFVLLWIGTSITVAVPSVMAACVLFLFLGQKGLVSLRPSDGEREQQQVARTIELALLQDVVDAIAPWLRVRARSPITAELLRDTALVRHRIDYLSGARCLTGLVGGRAPFCAAFVEAGFFAEAINYRTTRKRTPETVFRGIVAVLDAPGTTGWVTLEHSAIAGVSQLLDSLQDGGDATTLAIGHPGLERAFSLRASSADDARRTLTPGILEAVAAFVAANPDLPVSLAMRDDAIAVVIPMADDPFTLRDNPAMWERELRAFAGAAATIARLLETLHDARPAARQAVA
jgi:hypothetical protein